MKYDINEIAERIKVSMIEQNLKQTDIVKSTGVSKSSVSKWLNAKARPSGKYLTRLSEVLAVPEGWILDGDKYYDDSSHFYNDDPYEDLYLNIPDNGEIIRQLGLDSDVTYSTSYLKDLYEDKQWAAFEEFQKEHRDLTAEQERHIKEIEDFESDLIETDNAFVNSCCFEQLENGVSNFKYTEDNLLTPTEVSRLAGANLKKTFYCFQEDESMEPIILRSAQCIVELGNLTLVDGKYYLIKIGMSYAVRALFRTIEGGLILHCENDRFIDQTLSFKEAEVLPIIGRLYAWINIDTI